MKNIKKAFTIIEILIWILVSSIIIIAWFQSITYVMVWKVKLIESTNIEKEAFKFSQKFFEEIKSWGLIDYEEYFNRKVINWDDTWSAIYSSWHFIKSTWFWNYWVDGDISTWNYWKWFYYCRSWNWNKMTWIWCVRSFNTEWNSVLKTPQRYGQYSFQFIDYNSNNDWDNPLWDENWDGNIIWDDDDEHLWKGPNVFETGTGVTELYLISADKTKRTLFRWTVKEDNYNKPSTATCNTLDWWKTYSWSWCLGTIEFLRLEWRDWGEKHDKDTASTWLYDWVIDTWLINKDFAGHSDYSNPIIAGEGNIDSYWMPLFPDSISVKSFDIIAYPNKDIEKAWKEELSELSPYVRLKITLTPSWKVKARIRWKIPEFNISTTVNLTELFSI